MENEQYSRIIGLIGEETFLKIRDKKIFLAGLGGVGGTAYEALVRMGFSHFVLVDKDRVALSNLNRQILYTLEDINKNKVEVAISRSIDIDDEVDVVGYVKDAKEVLEEINDADIIIDCIDDISAKVELIKFAKEHNIPIVVSMGMANKLDPTQITISSINKSTVDPLAKKLRYELKQAGIEYNDIPCVYSKETPFKDGTKLNSIITVTSTAGLYVAHAALNILKK